MKEIKMIKEFDVRQLNGNTINLFNDWIRILKLREEHSHWVERNFIHDILGLTASSYYRKRARVATLKEEFDAYVDYLKKEGKY